MMVKKKKAQVALEILVIFGILVIGAVIFALFYSTNIRNKVDISSNVQGTYSDIENNLLGEDPQQPIEICGNGYCGLGENSANCPDDCGEPNSLCPTTPLNISVKMIPNEGVPAGAPGHNTFDLKVSAIRQPGYDDKEIIVKKISHTPAMSSNAIYYNGESIPLTGIEINGKMEKESKYYSYVIANLSGVEPVLYPLNILVEVPGCEGLETSSTTVVYIKRLSARLSLSPDGSSNRNEPFGVNVSVHGYNSDSNISITNIFVTDKRGNFLNNVCSYNREDIPSSGKSVNLLLDKRQNNYNYSFVNNIACSQPGQFNLIFTLHDNDENTDYDYNATIFKSIEDRCLFLGNEGDGTESRPYVIYNADDLDCIRYNLSKHFILGANIDLNHTNLSKHYWYDSEKGWAPIGAFSSRFTGSLNGNGNYISNLYSRRTEYDIHDHSKFYSGLFLAGVGAKFSNLNLINVDINSKNGGALIGQLNHGVIEDVNVTGNIIGGGAGLVNAIYDTNITGCSFTGNRTGGLGSIRGGLINIVANQANCMGDCYDENEEHLPSYIRNCYFSGNFSNVSSFSGGLIGAAQGAIIDGCYVTGNVSGKGFCTGGLVGGRPRSINKSYSTADVFGESRTGGLVGCADIVGNERGKITNSYSTGNITAKIAPYDIDSYGIGGLAGIATTIYDSYSTGAVLVDGNANMVGGLVGVLLYNSINNYSTSGITVNGYGKHIGGLVGHGKNPTFLAPQTSNIANCYSTGKIDVSGSKTAVGGLVGSKTSLVSVSKSYWDINTSGYKTSAGGEGRTTEAMTHPDHPGTYESWDFLLTWAQEPKKNNGYPYLHQKTVFGPERGEDLTEDVIRLFSPFVFISEDGDIISSDLINN